MKMFLPLYFIGALVILYVASILLLVLFNQFQNYIKIKRFHKIFQDFENSPRSIENMMTFLFERLPGVCIKFYGHSHEELIKIDTFYKVGSIGRKRGRLLLDSSRELDRLMPAVIHEFEKQGLRSSSLENFPEVKKEKQSFSIYILMISTPGQHALINRHDEGKNKYYCVSLVDSIRKLPDRKLLNDLSLFLEQKLKTIPYDKEKINIFERRDKSIGEDKKQLSQMKELYLKQIEKNYKIQKKLDDRESFLKRVTHDIRIPLSGIMLTSEILEKKLKTKESDEREIVENKEMLKLIKRIRSQLTSIEGFTYDILQVETGARHIDTAVREYSINEIIEKLLNENEDLLRMKKIKLSFKNGIIEPCRLDHSILTRILYNLISNSIKFCSNPGKIEVTTRQEDHFFILEIADTGPGLPSGAVVFDLSRKNIGRGGSGWGIGLASAHELSLKIGGILTSIEPRSGRGACFLLVLPMHKNKMQ